MSLEEERLKPDLNAKLTPTNTRTYLGRVMRMRVECVDREPARTPSGIWYYDVGPLSVYLTISLELMADA